MGPEAAVSDQIAFGPPRRLEVPPPFWLMLFSSIMAVVGLRNGAVATSVAHERDGRILDGFGDADNMPPS